ncbi:MAG TPA: hypothetical protein RMG48_21070 [Myxococcales bacterium LLY-WYZ-16_1]|jgi:hypothetical protein|nr:hypothetical protein [Myxococcales bacterium LLY-WYZ-16_1]
MDRHRSGPAAFGLCVALASFGLGCEGPCRSLSVQVCECAPSPREEAACIRRLDLNESQQPEPTRAEQERCEALLDTCTCEALALGLPERCGISRDFRFSEPDAPE